MLQRSASIAYLSENVMCGCSADVTLRSKDSASTHLHCMTHLDLKLINLLLPVSLSADNNLSTLMFRG